MPGGKAESSGGFIRCHQRCAVAKRRSCYRMISSPRSLLHNRCRHGPVFTPGRRNMICEGTRSPLVVVSSTTVMRVKCAGIMLLHSRKTVTEGRASKAFASIYSLAYLSRTSTLDQDMADQVLHFHDHPSSSAGSPTVSDQKGAKVHAGY